MKNKENVKHHETSTKEEKIQRSWNYQEVLQELAKFEQQRKALETKLEGINKDILFDKQKYFSPEIAKHMVQNGESKEKLNEYFREAVFELLNPRSFKATMINLDYEDKILKTVNYLLTEKKVDANLINPKGESIIEDILKRTGSGFDMETIAASKIINLLAKNGANLNHSHQVETSNGDKANTCILKEALKKNIIIAEKLIDLGADPRTSVTDYIFQKQSGKKNAIAIKRELPLHKTIKKCGELSFIPYDLKVKIFNKRLELDKNEGKLSNNQVMLRKFSRAFKETFEPIRPLAW